MKIVIDAGHGGIDNGASGKTSKEADVNLDVSKELAKVLTARNYDVFMTRTGKARLVANDALKDRIARAEVANVNHAHAFISIHCNGAENPQANGFEIFTTTGQNRSDLMATAIFNAWAKEYPDQKMRTDYTDGDPDKEANFTVIKRTRCPSCLIELGFITNPKEEKWLLDKKNQIKMANAIANGLDKFFKG